MLRAMENEPIVCESSADSLPDMSDWEFLDGVPDLPDGIDLPEEEHYSPSEIDSERRALSGFRKRWKRARSGFTEPSDGNLGDSETGDHYDAPSGEAIDVGGRSSNMDDNIAVTNAFIDRNRQSGIVLPWETPMLTAIFGEVVPSPSLGMPSSWGADIMKQQLLMMVWRTS